MSEFIFGEILSPFSMEAVSLLNTYLADYPFSFRFTFNQHDYFCRISATECHSLPYVITDSNIDNTAELLLRNDSVKYAEGTLPESYRQLLSKSLSERITLIVSALSDVLDKLDASECILVFSDGNGVPEEVCQCSLYELYDKLFALFRNNQYFATGCYRVYK